MSVSTVVLLIASLIAIGALAKPAAEWLRLPVSILHALAGIGIGFASLLALRYPEAPLAFDVARLLADLPVGSPLFLYVFLPTLLFQSALSVDMHRIREDLLPIVVLALVAVVVATFGIGLALTPFTELSLVACLLVAAVVATTDPVAVIAIFRGVGAPERLTRLVEGESLFNDAAAIALFLVFSGLIVAPTEVTALRVVADFLLLPVGGALLGLALAWTFIEGLKLVGEDRVTSASLSLAVPFLCFWLAEDVFGVSGVIAVVAAGVTLASLAPGRIPSDIWRYLNDIWALLASSSAVLVFILTSLLVPRLMADATLGDLGLILVLFVAALLARALIMFAVFPLLARIGASPEVSMPYRIVTLWGGLRGSMTLVLALAVTENEAIPREVAAFVATLATGFTLATLFVQGTTLRPLIQRLGLDRLSEVDGAIRDLTLAAASGRVAQIVARLQRRVRTGAAAPEPDAAAGDTLRWAAARPRPEALDLAHRTAIALVAVTAREREMVLDHFDAGTVTPPVARRIVADARRRLDASRLAGAAGYREATAAEVAFTALDRLAVALQRRFGAGRLLARRLSFRFERLLEASLVAGELPAFVEAELRPVLGAAASETAGELIARRRLQLGREIAALRLQYPDFAAALERWLVRRSARAVEAAEYERMRRAGVVNAEVERHLREDLRRRAAEDEGLPVLDLGLDTGRLIDASALFKALPEGQKSELARLLRPVFVVPGTRIVTRGERGDAAYFISSGAVEVDTGTALRRLGRGDVFGEMALVFDQKRQADVTAIAYSTLLRLSARDFRDFLDRHPAIGEQVRSLAEARRAENAARSRQTAVATG